MSDFSKFMKQNKKQKENFKYAPTKSLCDENGKPLEFEFKPIGTKEDREIRDACTNEIPVKGKIGMYRQKLNTSLYLVKLVSESIVSPDLKNAKLQDSYGVKTPEDLIEAMVDDSNEFNEMLLFIQKQNGLDVTLEDEVEQAKN